MLQAALQHHLAGRLSEAEALYLELLANHASVPDALHLLGEIACQRGHYGRAAELIEQAIAAQPTIASYHLNLGRVYKQQGRLDQAIACYRQALVLQPGDGKAHNSLGNALLALDRPDEAIAAYRAALSFQPGWAEVHCNLGNALAAHDKPAEALDCYLEALALTPDDVDLYNKLGNVLRVLGKLEEACASYEIGLALAPDLAETHCNIGNIYQEQGKLDAAIASYRKAIELKADFPAPHNNLGNALLAHGRPDEAVACFEAALALAPGFATAHCNLGHARKAQGLQAQAIVHYRRALALDAYAPEHHFSLGLALMEQGRLDEAADSYHDALSLKADYLAAHCNLGLVLKDQGRLADALARYRLALEIAPDHAEALYNLGVVHGLLRQFAPAEDCYRRALAIEPDLVAAHVNLAAILRDDGRLDEAQSHRDSAHRKQALFIRRTPGAARTVLLLLDAGKGNIPFAHLLPAADNNLLEWMIEYATEEQFHHLPPYDVVFNAIGEPDVTARTAPAVARFLAGCDKKVLNAPAAVARTARHLLPELLAGVDGVLVPAVWRIEAGADWRTRPEFRFPALLRPPATHGGEGMLKVDSRAALAAIDIAPGAALYMCAYHDYRSADGYFRKYRIMFVDRQPYPYHLAISEQWMVHYASAAMLSPWKLAEERRFLEDPAAILGAAGMAAIAAIGRRLDLDYAGVDFSLLPDGRLLIFEANATMLAHPERESEALLFKNVHVQGIYDAFDTLLGRPGAAQP